MYENTLLECSPEYLESVIQYFKEHDYEFAALDRVREILLEGKPGRRFVAFTFDDGYADNLHHALPIFEKHGVPFTINVTTGFPDGHVVLWWYLLEDLLAKRERVRVPAEAGEEVFDCSDPGEARQAVAAIRRRVKYASRQELQPLLEEIFSGATGDLYARTRELALTWEQIEAVSANPLVTLGAHSVNHYVLNRLSEEEARYEITESRARLQAHSRQTIRHFAYPFGSYNEAGEREFRLVREAGYDTAVSTRIANIFPQHANHLECLPRLDAPRLGGLAELEMAVNGLTPLRVNRGKRVVTA